MDERANMFDDDEPVQPAKKLNLAGFAPKTGQPGERKAEAIREAAERANFVSREPAKRPVKTDRRHRTGRNRTLAAKVTAETEALLYRIYDSHKDVKNWTLGEIIGMALQAFQRELEKSGKAS
jgi:hypothetical protein